MTFSTSVVVLPLEICHHLGEGVYLIAPCTTHALCWQLRNQQVRPSWEQARKRL